MRVTLPIKQAVRPGLSWEPQGVAADLCSDTQHSCLDPGGGGLRVTLTPPGQRLLLIQHTQTQNTPVTDSPHLLRHLMKGRYVE